MRRTFLYVSLSLLILDAHIQTIAAGERENFQSIKKYPSVLSSKQLQSCKSFLKTYPGSANAQDVKIILAKNEKSPSAALSRYEELLNDEVRDDIFNEAILSVCQIATLLSKYDICEKFARKAMRRNPSSAKLCASYLIRSDIMLQNYDDADSNLMKYSEYLSIGEKRCFESTISVHTGNDRVSMIRPDSDASLLYLSGRNFEMGNNRRYAYSAYKDLMEKFPRSPEALLCAGEIASLEKSSVRYTGDYLKTVKRQPVDTMTPDREIPDDQADLSYSVIIGPFNGEKEARILKKEVTEDFDGVVIVKKGKGFFVFIGNEPSAEMAVSLKMRLAEEFGLNGKIVQRRDDNGREYIYGE